METSERAQPHITEPHRANFAMSISAVDAATSCYCYCASKRVSDIPGRSVVVLYNELVRVDRQQPVRLGSGYLGPNWRSIFTLRAGNYN